MSSKRLVSVIDNSFSNLNEVTKLGNYAESFLLKEKVKKRGYDDFIKIGENGQLFEASTSNIIFTLGNFIYSPLNHKKNPYLDGITLSNVRKKCIVREDIFLNKIKKYEYCFLTNSVDYLVNVDKIDNVEFGKVESGSKNYWLRKILDIY